MSHSQHNTNVCTLQGDSQPTLADEDTEDVVTVPSTGNAGGSVAVPPADLAIVVPVAGTSASTLTVAGGGGPAVVVGVGSQVRS